MTDAFVRLNDPQKRAILATEAFGRGGAQFGEFLHQGSAAIQKQQIEYLRLTGSQEKFADSASALDDALRDMNVAFLGLRNAAAAGLFPALTQVSRVVTELVVSNRTAIAAWAAGAAASIKAWVDGGGVQRLADGIGDLTGKIGAFVDKIGGMRTVAIAVGAVLAGPLLAAIVGLVPAVISLGVALLTTPLGWFALAAGAIAVVGVKIYQNWAKVKEFFNEFFPEQVKAAKDLADAIREIYELWKKFDTWRNRPLFTDAAGNPTGLSENIGKPAAATPGASWSDAAQTVRSLFGARLGQPLGPTGPGSYDRAKAHVVVDFKNVPKGTRVTQSANSGADVDLNAGYAMAGN